MNTDWKNPKLLAGVATALFFVSLIGFLNVYKINSSLEGNLKDQKLKSEVLLSEKLQLEKNLDKFRGDLNALKGLNADLDKELAATMVRLDTREAAYRKLQSQNTSLAGYKKQHETMVALKRELEETISGLNATLTKMQREQSDFTNTIAALEQRNQFLQQELNRSLIASLDQPRIETLKGKKERLTVMARKTKKMKVNVEIPADLNAVTFRVKNPDGLILNENDGTIASRIVEDPSLLADGAAVNGKPVKKIEMEFNPSRKLAPGIYTIEILNDNEYVGSMQVSLR
jgi:hypothetical protein